MQLGQLAVEAIAQGAGGGDHVGDQRLDRRTPRRRIVDGGVQPGDLAVARLQLGPRRVALALRLGHAGRQLGADLEHPRVDLRANGLGLSTGAVRLAPRRLQLGTRGPDELLGLGHARH